MVVWAKKNRREIVRYWDYRTASHRYCKVAARSSCSAREIAQVFYSHSAANPQRPHHDRVAALRWAKHFQNGYTLVILKSSFYSFSCIKRAKIENSADTTTQAQRGISLIAIKAEQKKGAGDYSALATLGQQRALPTFGFRFNPNLRDQEHKQKCDNVHVLYLDAHKRHGDRTVTVPSPYSLCTEVAQAPYAFHAVRTISAQPPYGFIHAYLRVPLEEIARCSCIV